MKSFTFVLLAAVPAVMAQASCEPHEDHWHCPDGVPEPTFPPGGGPASSASAIQSAVSSALSSLSARASSLASVASSTATQIGSITVAPSATSTDDHDHRATAASCEPHDDHWHCPSGVSKPTTPPAQSTTGGESQSAATTVPLNSASQSVGAAAPFQTAGAVVAAIGAFGAFFV